MIQRSSSIEREPTTPLNAKLAGSCIFAVGKFEQLGHGPVGGLAQK